LRKPKIYLDTSVISHYFADDTPEKMAVTRIFFDEVLIKNKYEVCLSSLVLEELEDTPDPDLRRRLLELAYKLQAEVFTINPDVNRIAKLFIDERYIPPKYKEDSQHLGFALFYNVDYIVSWNFKHFVRPKIKDAVEIIAIREGTKRIKILTPEEVVADENSEI
jgi:predicted nucleic acid-binding protein